MTNDVRRLTGGRSVCAAIAALSLIGISTSIQSVGAEELAAPTVVVAEAVPQSQIPVAVGAEQFPAAEDYSAEEKRWETLRPAADAIYAVSVDFPEDFAYSDFTETGFIVGFRAAAPEAAIARLKATQVEFSVVTDAGYSQLEIEPQLTLLNQELSAKVEGKVNYVVGANTKTGRFEVTFYTDDAQFVKEAAAAAESARSARLFPVEYKTADGTVQEASYGLAAGSWLIDAAGNGQCTSGFVVKSVSSAGLGLLTAGHCPNFLRHYQAGVDNFALNFVTQVHGLQGDAQYNQSPKMLDAWFHANVGYGKPVLDARNPLQGEWVCRYGMVSANMLCGNILLASTQQNVEGIMIGNLAVAQLWVNRGDSGGPVFGGNTAMGLNAAGTFEADNVTPIKTPGGMAELIMKIDAAEYHTGTKVCLDPVCS